MTPMAVRMVSGETMAACFPAGEFAETGLESEISEARGRREMDGKNKQGRKGAKKRSESRPLETSREMDDE